MPRDTRALLNDILEAAEYIKEETAGLDYRRFRRDRRARHLVEFYFVRIGEAIVRLRRIDQMTSVRIGNVEAIIGFRNAIVHGYDHVD